MPTDVIVERIGNRVELTLVCFNDKLASSMPPRDALRLANLLRRAAKSKRDMRKEVGDV